MKIDRLDQILAGAKLSEAERIERVKRAGDFPEGCGPAPVVAPARGALRLSSMKAVYPKGEGEFEVKDAGFQGRRTAMIADVFDLMAARGRQRFTPSQISVARYYKFLVERHAAGGMRCASLEALPSGGGVGGVEWIDAYVDEGRKIKAMHRRIGSGVVVVPGCDRVAIREDWLVHQVCIGGLSLSRVLSERGVALKGRALSKAVDELARALGDCLDRMGCTIGVNRILSTKG
ncbi:hypothetical protein [Celeribacter sp.]|uniref:hypothetical protein n=1 Tax=Celeribacter sp. TaxID=1890673 RepID=UPI003A9266E2